MAFNDVFKKYTNPYRSEHRIGATFFVQAQLEKQSKFTQYNMKCRGKPDTT